MRMFKYCLKHNNNCKTCEKCGEPFPSIGKLLMVEPLQSRKHLGFQKYPISDKSKIS